MEIEKRTYTCEIRAGNSDSGSPTITGYGAIFNTRSENLGGFREIIAPGAFDSVLGDDVRGLFNHDPNFVLGRSTSGTLTLSVDEKGLKYDINAPDTQTIRDLVIDPMKRGDITQSSFAFRVARDGDEWEQDEEGLIIRTITKISRLFDVSPVTYPAYEDAVSATRSLDAWRTLKKEQDQLIQARIGKQSRERMLDMIGA